jgi:hypothetical protein
MRCSCAAFLWRSSYMVGFDLVLLASLTEVNTIPCMRAALICFGRTSCARMLWPCSFHNSIQLTDFLGLCLRVYCASGVPPLITSLTFSTAIVIAASIGLVAKATMKRPKCIFSEQTEPADLAAIELGSTEVGMFHPIRCRVFAQPRSPSVLPPSKTTLKEEKHATLPWICGLRRLCCDFCTCLGLMSQ